MKQNELETDDFFRLAKDLGVDEAGTFKPCVRTWEQGNQFLPENRSYWDYDDEAFRKGELKSKYKSGNRCNWIYISTVILDNGDVVPCCRDINAEFVMGNILREDFREIWNGKKYRDFRKKIAYMQKDLSICKLCSGFRIPPLYKCDLTI